MIEFTIIVWIAWSTFFVFQVAVRFIAIEERLDAIEKANAKLEMLSRAVDGSLRDHLREHAAPISRRIAP